LHLIPLGGQESIVVAEIFKTSDEKVQEMINLITGHYSKRTLKWQKLAQQCNVVATKKTVQKAMERAGYHKCKACQKAFISPQNA